MSRLDRLLVTPKWEAHFPSSIQSLLPHTISDYSPILLDNSGSIKGGKSNFKFENMCLKTNVFMERVKQWRVTFYNQGPPSYILIQKIQALK
jgi:hypothetical protein